MSNLMGNDMNGQPNQVGVSTMLNTRNAQDNNVANDSMNRDTDSSVRTETNRDKVLVGIFETENEVINVITQLKKDGYREDEISMISRTTDSSFSGEFGMFLIRKSISTVALLSNSVRA